MRALLAFVTLVCVILGIWLERARRQHEIVKAVGNSGGHVTYSRDSADGPGRKESIWHRTAFGRDLFCRVYHVRITDRRLLARVIHLTALESLTVEDDLLSDQDVLSLLSLSRLKSVKLMGSRTGGVFSGTPGLAKIDVSYFHNRAGLTDHSVRQLARRQNLQDVTLKATDLSLDTIQGFAELESLRGLYIDCSRIGGQTRPRKEWLEPFEDLPNIEQVTIFAPDDVVSLRKGKSWQIVAHSDRGG